MNLIDILSYLGVNAGVAFAGILYWWTVENFQTVESGRKTIEKIPLVIILIMVLSPIGAWIVSAIVKSRRIIRDIRKVEG